MKVICISGSRFLIKGDVYEVTNIDGDMYELARKDPFGEWNSRWFNKMNFETIEDKRNRRLEELGI